MRILMLGWEFPPFIAGGLGTACYGLTRALDRLGHEIVFVLPKAVDRSHSTHIRLLSPAELGNEGAGGIGVGPERNGHRPRRGLAGRAAVGATGGGAAMGSGEGMSDASEYQHSAAGGAPSEQPGPFAPYTMEGFAHTVFHGLAGGFTSPYCSFGAKTRRGQGMFALEGGDVDSDDPETSQARTELDSLHDVIPLSGSGGGGGGAVGGGAGAGYDGDMITNAERYARLVQAVARRQKFDVIHAHDWMTFPAGVAMARLSGRPLVVHVHSTEFDRAGDNPNQRVYDIERRGMHAALRVIAVSNLTRSLCTHRYGVDAAKVDVVWNGIDNETAQPHQGAGIASKDKIVLFLGRITMQKGPEYFIRAAKRVLEKVENVKFVVAGSGDMAVRMIEEAAALGIGHKVTFTGFLRGSQVDRVFQMADCYVMPSVSEPFGIAPLEAMRNDVPVIISKQSGVSEAITHALKVDFWDIDEMANKIVAVLRHPPLGQTLREHGAFELRKLTWDGAAGKCVESYEKAVAAQGRAGAGALRPVSPR